MGRDTSSHLTFYLSQARWHLARWQELGSPALHVNSNRIFAMCSMSMAYGLDRRSMPEHEWQHFVSNVAAYGHVAGIQLDPWMHPRDVAAAHFDGKGAPTAAGRAWELRLMTFHETIELYRALHHLGASEFPAHRLDELMYLSMSSAPWQTEEGESLDYFDGFEAMAVDMMKQLHPEAADGLELFRGQICQAFPEFKFNEPAARLYVARLVEGQAERFELPDLD